MKTNIFKTTLMAFAAITLLAACGNDKAAAPVVTLTEVGHDNSYHATPGDDLHLEADIVAEGLINAIHVELLLKQGGEYEIEKSYTDGKYIGVRNTEFHEHIDIPADAPAGEYHLHFSVTDREGQQTTATAHVDIAHEN